MKEVKDSTEIEVGDIVQIRNGLELIVEGEIEFIDFSIPQGIVILKISGQNYSTAFYETYLVREGERTSGQKLLKRERLLSVMKRKQLLDKYEGF